MPVKLSQRRSLKPWQWIAMLATSYGAWLVLGSFFNHSTFQQGEQAYEAANCEAAIPHYDRIIKNAFTSIDSDDYVARAQARKSECLLYQEAVQKQQAGNVETALLTYIDFMNRHPNSPLGQLIRPQTAILFTQQPLPVLAKPALCERITQFKQSQLIPELTVRLPAFYEVCGATYAAAQQHSRAVAMYEQFLTEYPNHAHQGQVKQALATALIAEARQQGAGSIPPPLPGNPTLDGSTVVDIRNDSPTRMRLVFSGSETQYQEIAPCFNCQTYAGSGPKTCPNKGQTGRFVLKPGTYDVVVKSISDRQIKPFIGKWTLAKGQEYNHCFFIVTQPRDLSRGQL